MHHALEYNACQIKFIGVLRFLVIPTHFYTPHCLLQKVQNQTALCFHILKRPQRIIQNAPSWQYHPHLHLNNTLPSSNLQKSSQKRQLGATFWFCNLQYTSAADPSLESQKLNRSKKPLSQVHVSSALFPEFLGLYYPSSGTAKY